MPTEVTAYRVDEHGEIEEALIFKYDAQQAASRHPSEWFMDRPTAERRRGGEGGAC